MSFLLETTETTHFKKFINDLNDNDLIIKNNSDDLLKQIKLENKYANDYHFMKRATKQNKNAIHYATDELKKKTKFIHKTLKYNEEAYSFLLKDAQNRQSIFLYFYEINPKIIKYIDDELRNDKEFMYQLIDKNSQNIMYASNELLNDDRFMTHVMMNGIIDIYLYVGNELKQDVAFIKNLFQFNTNTWNFIYELDQHMLNAIIYMIESEMTNKLFEELYKLTELPIHYDIFNSMSITSVAIKKNLTNIKYFSDKIKNIIFKSS